MRINANAMQSHQILMDINANNIANINNNNFTAKEGRINNNLNVSSIDTSKSTDIAKEITNQITIENGFEAQIPVITTEDEMLGTLLNIKG
jgi:flagellar hook protein FlgE